MGSCAACGSSAARAVRSGTSEATTTAMRRRTCPPAAWKRLADRNSRHHGIVRPHGGAGHRTRRTGRDTGRLLGERMPIDAYFRGLFEMVAKPISEFKQGDHTGKAPRAVTDEKNPRMTWTMPAGLHTLVKGGFCKGASLDWLRKVIQRDDPARYAITHRKWSRVSRMANTHVQQRALRSGFVDNLNAKADAGVAAAMQSQTAALAQAKRLLVDWAEASGCTYEED